MQRIGFCTLLCIVIGASGARATDPMVTLLRESFEGAPTGEVPKGWVPSETNGDGMRATWRVVEYSGDASAPNGYGKKYLEVSNARNTGERYNLLLSQAQFAPSFRMSVSIRADSGSEDQGGGLLWQAQSKREYYVTRWNPLERNLRLYHVSDGSRKMLFGTGVNVSTSKEGQETGWHRLQVEVRGNVVKVQLDDHVAFQCHAEPLAGAGRIGFWTKADADVSFDGLEFRHLPPWEPGD